MQHPGYLTRRDKIGLGIAVVLLAPLATFGFPFLGLAAVIVIFGALIYYFATTIAEKQPDPGLDTPLRRVRFTRFLSKPQKIRHHYTVNTSEPRDPDP